MIEDSVGVITNKKMLSIEEMIDNLKNKNIKFEKMSEDDAKKYLKYNNNYHNLTAYKKDFLKYNLGKLTGKYIDLDFAYLKDLSIIDMRTRILLFKMVIDIEHYLKIKILNTIESIPEEDGYRIVNMYLEYDYNKNAKRLHNSIFKKIGSADYQKIFSKYDIDKDKKLENIPIWEFLEIVTFGELISFYEYFTNEYNLEEEKKDIFIFREIVKLRNAVAHNTNILTELDKRDYTPYQPSYKVIAYLKESNMGKKIRNKKMSNSRIRQITYALYMFNQIVTSDGIKKNIKKEINDLFFNRIIKHKEYYNNNELLKSVYLYFSKIIKMSY